MEWRVRPEAVLEAVAEAFGIKPQELRRRQYDCMARAAAAWLLSRHGGMNQRDVGAWLGMGTGSAVCQQVKRLRCVREEDVELAARLRLAESTLQTGSAPACKARILILKG